ncbi:hypothetical protein V1478_014523 [Vespula squamosa]|uniref:Uncharacterized protein n=1 Tax=Vespula squamosa TaxID=30214 RepID=A0ABD2A8H2_VESSQ
MIKQTQEQINQNLQQPVLPRSIGSSRSLMESRIPPSIFALSTFSTKWRIASSKRQEAPCQI